MHSFTDTTGRVWKIDLDDEARARILEGLGVAEIHTDQLADDPQLLGQVLWQIIAPQAEAIGFEPKRFGPEVLRNPAAAVDALYDEIKSRLPLR